MEALMMESGNLTPDMALAKKNIPMAVPTKDISKMIPGQERANTFMTMVKSIKETMKMGF